MNSILYEACLFQTASMGDKMLAALKGLNPFPILWWSVMFLSGFRNSHSYRLHALMQCKLQINYFNL